MYEVNGDARTHETVVVSVTPMTSLSDGEQRLFKQTSPDGMVITTRETIFHAQGGGQPFDTGSMVLKSSEEDPSPARFRVDAVRRNGDAIVLHQGRMEASGTPVEAFRESAVVTQIVDGTKRDLHSRIHTGGHLLGLAVRELRSEISDVAESKAQHYPGAAFVEFQGKIEAAHKDRIQQKLDELVEKDLPVSVARVSLEDIKERRIYVPEGFVRKGPDEDMRVVEIGNLGGYPCGGTHVHGTAELVKVTVRKISSSKGVTKISYEVQ